jgi:ferredoxin-NADP reductase
VAVAQEQPDIAVSMRQPPEERAVVAERIEHVADDVVSLVLTAADGSPLPCWQPGAHIDLILAPGLERQYSLCGDPRDLSHWRIGVLREQPSRGGSARVHRLNPGRPLRVRGPRNHFRLVESKRYVFIAGGIGITPILPMVEQVARGNATWQLVYGGRTAASMAFTDRLARYGAAVTLWPQDEHGFIDLEAVLGTPQDDTAVYCCGPGALISAVEARVAAWPEGTLHVERFAPREGALDGECRAFEVRLARTGLTVQVDANQSIVDALAMAGIPVATSCRRGTCGTCETHVLEGTPDHRDSILTAGEQERGDTMMICCSRATGPSLLLDL